MGLSFKEKVIKYGTYEFCEQYTDPQKMRFRWKTHKTHFPNEGLVTVWITFMSTRFAFQLLFFFFFFLPELVALFMRHEQCNYANEQCFLV